ncbi:MAG: tRNA pseudouridine(13) synthase TruD [Proteobacteria bacterium]|nr:tRNA pseudouridine(13) synthase TruD [Pseudomonadota bacterium]
MNDHARHPAEPVPEWPATQPAVLTRAVIKLLADDFVVIENTGIEPTGEGEHLWLRLRKTGFSTQEAVKQLASASSVAQRDIGYAGLKDRHAVTEQWMSVLWPIANEPDWLGELPAGIEVLQQRRHGRKLRKGALKGNAFELTLREVEYDDKAAVDRRIQEIQQQGFPNYFAEQRFGRDGANVSKAKAMFDRSMKVRDRFRRGMFLSAARSWIFNHVLAERVRQGSWNQALAGEICALEGSRQHFKSQPDDPEIKDRIDSGDIHPSGPLWGDGEPESSDEAYALESRIAATEPELVSGLAGARMDHDRRALRVIPQSLQHEWLADDKLKLSFSLPAGVYATALLRELGRYETAFTQYPDSDKPLP